MKIFTVFLFLFSFFLAKAQTYTPMADGEKYWWYISNVDDVCKPLSGFMLGLSTDTVVSGLNYKMMYRYSLEGSSNCEPGQWPCFSFNVPYAVKGKELIGLIRDDTVAQKVYVLPISTTFPFCSDEEYLLFDFGQSQGDSLNPCALAAVAPSWNTTDSWGSVDTITDEFYYGKDRKVVHTKGVPALCGLSFISGMKLIAGVGFESFGLFKTDSLGTGVRTSLDHYCEGSWADCNIISGNQGIYQDGLITLSPNPLQNQLNIALPDAYLGKATISFYDVLGHFIVTDLIKYKELDVSDLPEGLLFYEVQNNDVLIGRGKLVKIRN